MTERKKYNVSREMAEFERLTEVIDSEQTISQESATLEHVFDTHGGNDELERDFANQVHGKLSLLRGINTVLRSVEIKALKEMKDSKLFKKLRIQDESGNVRMCGNFEEYCKYQLGISKSYAYELINDFDAFGDAVDGLRRMGVERSHLRLLRKASDDVIEEVRTAADKNDKEGLLEIIDDLSAKHTKEKEALEAKNKALEEDKKRLESRCEADQKVRADKDQKINELERELRRELTPNEEKQRLETLENSQRTEMTTRKMDCLSALAQFEETLDTVQSSDSLSESLEEQFYGDLLSVMKKALSIGRSFRIDPVQVLGCEIDRVKLDAVLDQGL